MIQLPYRKGVYMLVSAISTNNSQAIFNINVNSRGGEISPETLPDVTNLNNTKPTKKELIKTYSNINEWKNFCHYQIEKGNFNVIV